MVVQAGMVISGAFCTSMATTAIENNLKNSVFSSLPKNPVLNFSSLFGIKLAVNQSYLVIPI